MDACTSRSDFVHGAAALAVAGAVSFIPTQAEARGRATLDQSYDRYTPRILAGGEFYKTELRQYIAQSNWEKIKDALAEPPKRTKEDKAKADGGIPERAAKAGGFSEARVLVACDLFAAAFSDNSVSPKTKKMKAEVEELTSIVEQMSSAARQALGEESGGGFLGFGSKKLSKDELSRKVKELYIQGGSAWNKYIFEANDGLPVQLKKLPYL